MERSRATSFGLLHRFRDESEDKWTLGTTTASAGDTGNLNITAGTLVADLEGSVTTAAQSNITSLGTLTALTVDDVAIDGKVITMTGSSSDTATITVGTNGTLAITKNEFRSDELGISGHDSTVTPPNYAATGGTNPNSHGGNFQKHIVSTGSYSNSGDGDINLSTGSANTFFPPVQSVEVYGTHRLNIASQTGTTPSGTTELFSISAGGGFHHTDFWNLVIDIKMRGYDDGYSSGGTSQADKEWFKSRTNVFFQPFGETASFDISDNEHTS